MTWRNMNIQLQTNRESVQKRLVCNTRLTAKASAKFAARSQQEKQDRCPTIITSTALPNSVTLLSQDPARRGGQTALHAPKALRQ